MKRYKPTTPSRRHMTREDFSMLTKKKAEKALLSTLNRKAGRNNQGRITVRHKGGGVKRLYRIVDFGQRKINIPGKVIALEYDPNRTSFIILIEYEDGEKRYRLAPQEIKVGDSVIIKDKAEIKTGNRMKLTNIPIGTEIYNLELVPGSKGKMVRSAGSSAKVLGAEGNYIHIKMPSSEIRKIHQECFASIGSLSRAEHRYIRLGKAGKKRYKGIRPTVRGSAMSPVDHPHGGGEGRAGIGLKYPKTPWGKPALGKKTRRKRKSNKFILKRRNSK